MARLRFPLVHLAGLLLFLVCAGPVGLSLFASVMPDQAIFGFPPNWFGYDATLDNYRYIFTGQIPAVYLTAGANRGMISDAARQVPAGMWHSTVVAFGVMATNIALGAPAAYAFARCRFYGQTASFLAIILSRLVPAVALVTPFYLIVQELGLLGTRTALVLVHSVLTLPFTVLILTIFFRRIPPRDRRARPCLTAAIGCRCSGTSSCRSPGPASSLPACSPLSCPMPSSCSPSCCRVTPPTGH